MQQEFDAPSSAAFIFALFRSFFCFGGFCEVVFTRRTLFSRLSHGFLAAVGDAFLLGVNVGVKAGLPAGHVLFSEVAMSTVNDLAVGDASRQTRKFL
jgi:hypothetical protein